MKSPVVKEEPFCVVIRPVVAQKIAMDAAIINARLKTASQFDTLTERSMRVR